MPIFGLTRGICITRRGTRPTIVLTGAGAGAGRPVRPSGGRVAGDGTPTGITTTTLSGIIPITLFIPVVIPVMRGVPRVAPRAVLLATVV